MSALIKDGLLSVIIPAYNEEAMLLRASEEIRKILSSDKITHELIFVDDGSSDATWQLICAEADRYPVWCEGCAFREISARKAQSPRGSNRQREIAAWSSTAICSILRRR